MDDKNKKKISKILLVNPPNEFKTPVLPLGLASIAAYLKNKGVNVFVIDAWAEKLNFEELADKVRQTEADLVGIHMVSPRYKEAEQTIKACRQALPKAVIIAGGPHPSAVPEQTLKEIEELDICIVGEGEITIYELAECLQKNSPPGKVNGIAYRDKNGQVIITKPREYIKELDSLPFPARELFPLDKYRTHPPYGRKNPYFSMITSRGCPFNCAYCSKEVFSNIFRARSPEKICDEIEELIEKYGAKEIHFYDDDFTVDMPRAEKICDEILKRKLNFIWSCTTRVDLVNKNLLKKMKQTGCWLISYGVESGNQKILDTINKGIRLEQIISAFEMTRHAGISTLAYFMVSLPGETEKTVLETIALSKKLKPNFVSWGTLVVYPGSCFYGLAEDGQYQGKLKKLDQGENLAGTFFGKGEFIIFEDKLSLLEMRKLIKKANLSFYLRPSYLWQCLKNIHSFEDFIYYLRGGLEVIKSAL